MKATILAIAFSLLSLPSFCEEPAKPKAEAESKPVPGEKSLFDGKSLQGWKLIDYAGHGEIEAKDGELVINQGELLSGVKIDGKAPFDIDYEISLEAKRVAGGDFFCGLTFPIKDKHCTLVVGGWGGGLVGISSIDHMDASENQTQVIRSFEDGVWYKLRLRVTAAKFEVWIDEKQLIDFAHQGKHLSMRAGSIEDSVPLGLSTYQTKAAFRNIKIKPVKP